MWQQLYVGKHLQGLINTYSSNSSNETTSSACLTQQNQIKDNNFLEFVLNFERVYRSKAMSFCHSESLYSPVHYFFICSLFSHAVSI